MLTSHHYLFGGFVAVSCATGLLSYSGTAFQNLPQLSSRQAASTQALSETVDVSYRGSGRVGDNPTDIKETESKGPLAHRGSGRIRPHLL